MPYGIAVSARHVSSWNGVPAGAEGEVERASRPREVLGELPGDIAERRRVAPPGRVGGAPLPPERKVDLPEAGVVSRHEQ